jgi:hypothetical protein
VSPILGIWASQNYVRVTNSYESISTVTVGSGGQSSITFSSIPSTYKHLQVRAIGRSVAADTSFGYDMTCFFNGDSTLGNYYNHYMFGNGSSVGAGTNVNNAIFGGVFGAGSSANTFSTMIMDFLDYSSTSKTKVGRLLEGFDSGGGSTNLVMIQSTLWNNTSAISSLTFNVRSGTGFGQYSSFALYGIKG